MSAPPVLPPLPPSAGPILGVGVDIIEIDRVGQAVERGGERLVSRVFSGAEAAYCRRRRYPARHFAARFAAKEAVIKALRVPPDLGWLWSEIEVVRVEGPPSIRLTGRALGRARELRVSGCHLSLSHSDTHAVAVVVLT